ncbi:AEC family transporter [Palleronia sp. KMU-117]|uniref:AEC family transporter n=1 Tax=Palleronia sp. KMU-117 TaxID=3434108 RepID=UPI003D755BFA
MDNIVLLVFCFAAGIALRRLGRFPANASSVLNSFIINIGLPAMALAYLNGLTLSPELLFAAAAPWVLFLVGIAILWPLCRVMQFPRQTTGCVILVGGLANTSFIGIPMIEAFYGPEWMSVGVVMDQLGSYIVLTFLGITVARLFAEGPRPAPRDIARTILSFPPFIATVVALALMNTTYPDWLDGMLERLAVTVAPLALVSVGFQLRLTDIGGKLRPLILGLAYKLILGPLIVLGLLVWALGGSGIVAQITVFEVAMAPMIGASIVAMENDLDPQLATLLVGLGVPISFVTLTAWSYALAGI